MVFRKLEKIINENSKNRQLVYFSIFAIIMIPLSTYVLATEASPFLYTLSMIGNRLGHRVEFIIWGIIVGSMLSFYIMRLYVLKSFKHRKARRLLLRGIISLIISVTIPVTDNLMISKRFHLITATAFALCLVASLYLFTTTLQDHNKKAYNISIALLYILIGGSLLLLFIFGNTGIFELFFFTILTIYLIFVKYRTAD